MTNIKVRPSSIEDCEKMYEWWLDPLTRENMKSPNVPPFLEHFRWYLSQLKLGPEMTQIGEQNGHAFGVVRFIPQGENVYDTSIIIDADYRGRGLGKILMGKAIENFINIRKINIVLFATYKKKNLASRAIFLANNFVEMRPNIEYEKLKLFDSNIEGYCEREVERNSKENRI
jgi:L-amino acid N-acyltransferase YncA